MSTHKLSPEFRSALRDLIQGFIEHCEISQALIGQIEQKFDYANTRYGVPVFTFYGNPVRNVETSFVGLVGLNKAGERLTAEILLQLIERLALQPSIAAGRILRIMPVANPVALELQGQASDEVIENNSEVQKIIDGFRSQFLDGLVEIHTGPQSVLLIESKGNKEFREALERSREAMIRLAGEDSLTAPFGESDVPEAFEGSWHLRISVPQSWPASLAVHWVSQLLVVFFRSHTEALAREVPGLHSSWV